ncbi:hypothetical protein HQN88_33445 [Paenibacillus qinlingensis]|nr:hypothetical protein [Paenibacillus qinlingensis]
MLGKTEEDFKDEKGRIWFDKELADYIVFTFQQIDKPFLRKMLDKSKDITQEEAFEYQQAMLAYVETLEEPSKSEYKALYESLAINQSQSLLEKTLENLRELVGLYHKIPVEDQIELLNRLIPAMESWKIDLNKRIKPQ